MWNRKTFCLALAVSILILKLFFLDLTKAKASTLSLAIYPPIIQIRTIPGASVSAPISIENRANEAVKLRVILKPFTASEKENGQIKYLPDSQPNLFNSLLLQRLQILDDGHKIENFTLAPKQQKKFNLHIDMPANYRQPDYYFSVIFLSQETTDGKINHSQILGGVATNVLLSVDANAKAKGQIEGFTAPSFVKNGPLPFTIKIKNTGDHFTSAHGSILIKNIFGQIVGKIYLSPANILANSTRKISSIDQLTPGKSNHSRESSESDKTYWTENFILGYYTATLNVSLSSQGPFFTKTLYFIGFPIELAAEVIIGIFIVIFLISRVKSKVN